jgi:DNA repair exonuclease SbcCD ATPase subunit
MSAAREAEAGTVRPCPFCGRKLRSELAKSNHLRKHDESGEAVRLKKSVDSQGTVFMDWEIVVPVGRMREYEHQGWR